MIKEEYGPQFHRRPRSNRPRASCARPRHNYIVPCRFFRRRHIHTHVIVKLLPERNGQKNKKYKKPEKKGFSGCLREGKKLFNSVYPPQSLLCALWRVLVRNINHNKHHVKYAPSPPARHIPFSSPGARSHSGTRRSHQDGCMCVCLLQ